MVEKDFILNFEIDAVLDSFGELVKILQKQYFKDASYLNRHRFTNLLLEIIKVEKLWAKKIDFDVLIPLIIVSEC